MQMNSRRCRTLAVCVRLIHFSFESSWSLLACPPAAGHPPKLHAQPVPQRPANTTGQGRGRERSSGRQLQMETAPPGMHSKHRKAGQPQDSGQPTQGSLWRGAHPGAWPPACRPAEPHCKNQSHICSNQAAHHIHIYSKPTCLQKLNDCASAGSSAVGGTAMQPRAIARRPAPTHLTSSPQRSTIQSCRSKGSL